MGGEMHEMVPWFARGIRDHRTLVVAEIGNNHEGSLGNLLNMIDCARLSGADAVKIQYHLPEYECKGEYWPRRFSYHPQDKSRSDYWQRMSFGDSALREIDRRCKRLNINLIVSPFSVEAVDNIETLGLDIAAYKIASGEVNNLALLRAIKTTRRKVILSTGMSDTKEVNTAVCELLKEPYKVPKLYVLQCTTEYPTPMWKVGMNVVDVYCRNILFCGGLSDHSGSIVPSIIAAYLGAYMVEVHVCFHKGQFGADISSSVTFKELRRLVHGIRMAEDMRAYPVNKDFCDVSHDAMEAYRNVKVRKEANRYE